jgi:hypothetical protein
MVVLADVHGYNTQKLVEDTEKWEPTQQNTQSLSTIHSKTQLRFYPIQKNQMLILQSFRETLQ